MAVFLPPSKYAKRLRSSGVYLYHIPKATEMIVTAIPALKQVQEAKNLKSLSLSGLGLTSVPIDFSLFEGLERLDLSYNQLRKLPEEITQLKNLKVLRLAGNPSLCLAETLLTLANLPKLQKLDIAECRLRELPAELLHLDSLESLTLDKNPLEVFSHHMIKCLPEGLSSLSVIGCRLLAKIPLSMASMVSLKSLQVESCSFEWIERMYLINPEVQVYVRRR